MTVYTKYAYKNIHIMNYVTQPFKSEGRDFPSSPVVKTLLSKAGGAGSIPGSRAKNPQALCPPPPKKNKNKTESVL